MLLNVGIVGKLLVLYIKFSGYHCCRKGAKTCDNSYICFDFEAPCFLISFIQSVLIVLTFFLNIPDGLDICHSENVQITSKEIPPFFYSINLCILNWNLVVAQLLLIPTFFLINSVQLVPVKMEYHMLYMPPGRNFVTYTFCIV